MEVQRKTLENQSKMHASKSKERIALPKSITKKNHKFKENASIIYLLSKMKHKFSFRRTTAAIKRSKKLIPSDYKLKEAFNRYDTDCDGRVNPSDLGILIRSLGGNPTEAQVGDILRREKLNDPYDFERFVDLMGKHLRAEPVDREVRRAFQVIDRDSDGYVTVSDLRQLLTMAGERLDPNEFDEWIRAVGVGPDDMRMLLLH